MEDGAVSIFGLVFGMATAAETSADVLLAGATGAAAAAVSMMAGVWLDARSEGDRERALARRYAQMAARDPDRCAGEIARAAARLGHAGRRRAVGDDRRPCRERQPRTLAVALRGGAGDPAERSPTAHALWMFVADLFAGAVPVLPFAFLPIDTARWVSIGDHRRPAGGTRHRPQPGERAPCRAGRAGDGGGGQRRGLGRAGDRAGDQSRILRQN